MIFFIFSLFVFLMLLYLADSKNHVVIITSLLIAGIGLFLLAGLRGSDHDRDHYIYRGYWYTRSIAGDVEDSFIIIRNFLKYTLDLPVTSLFLVYAFLGVTVKFIGIYRMSVSVFASVLIYFSHYFFLHEFTQIRIGVAAGFMLIALRYIHERDLPRFLLFAACSIFFHYSAALVLPLWFIRSNDRLKAFYFLIPAGYLYYFLGTLLQLKIPIPYIQNRIDLYQEMQESGIIEMEKVNVFNAVFLVRVMLLYFFLYYAKKIGSEDSRFYLLVKIYALSLFSFLFFANLPVFAFRVQEFLGVVEILLVPYLVWVLGRGWPAKIAIVTFALVFLLFDLYYVELVLHLDR